MMLSSRVAKPLNGLLGDPLGHVVAGAGPLLCSVAHTRAVHLRGISSGAPSDGDATAGLIDHEKIGVPAGAGQDGKNGFNLGRMRRLLELLGDPHLKFPVVQVAGTKGKGSTAALLSNVLRAAGYNVGTYSSPHVTHESERLWCGKTFSCVSPSELDALKKQHMSIVAAAKEQEGPDLSYFEVMTGLAFKLFQEQKVDVAVVEAGLGGARDATNVFPASGQLLSILTAIGTDHKAALGDTVGEIANVKVGIARDGRPIVMAHQPETEARDVVVQAAQDKGSALLDVEADVAAEVGQIRVNGSGQLVQTCSFPASPGREFPALNALEMRLIGREQAQNAAAVVRACWHLASKGWRITPESVRDGFAHTALPGRCEAMSVEKDGRRQWLVLDAAHTPESAQSLSNTLSEALPGRAVVLVWAMLDDKDIRGFARALRGLKPKVVIITVGSGGLARRHANSGTLAGAWQIAAMEDRNPDTRRVRARELVMASMEAALAKAFIEVQSHEGEGLMVVTGSFSAVAAAKATTTCRDFFSK